MVGDTLIAENLTSFCRGDLAESTTRAYQRIWEDYAEVCHKLGLEPLAAIGDTLKRDVTVAYYVYQLDQRGLATSTITSKVSALNKVAEDLATCLTKRALESIRRRPPREPDRWPLNSDHVFKIKESADKQLEAFNLLSGQYTRQKGITVGAERSEMLKKVQRKVACIMGFALLLRKSSIVSILAQDIRVLPESVDITIRKEKFKSKPHLMTVGGALAQWLKEYIASGVLPTTGEQEIFKGLQGDPNLWLKETLQELKIRPPPHTNFTWHSLRIGGTTALTRSGSPVPLEVTQQWGNWRGNHANTAMRDYQRFDSKPGSHDNFFFNHLQRNTW